MNKLSTENFNYILECLGVDAACIRTNIVCCRCWGSSFRDHSFMLNGARTHHRINSPVSHSTSSSKSHSYRKREKYKFASRYTDKNHQLSIAWVILHHIPWAMVDPMAPSIDPPPPPCTEAGGGAWLTATWKSQCMLSQSKPKLTLWRWH